MSVIQNVIRVVDTRDGRQIHKLFEVTKAVQFSKDNDQLFIADGKQVHILDMATGKETDTLEGAVQFLSLSGNGRVLAGRGRRSLLIWDTKTKTLTRTIALPDNFGAPFSRSMDNLALSADGKTIAAVGPGGIAVWDTTTGKERYRNQDRFADEPIALAPDGRTVVWARYSWSSVRHAFIARHDLAAERDLVVCPGHEAPVIALAFAPDGKQLASIDGHQHTCIWSMGQGQPEPVCVKPGANDVAVSAASVAYSPDGKVLAVPDKGAIRLLDPATGKDVRQLPGVAGRSLLAFAP